MCITAPRHLYPSQSPKHLINSWRQEDRASCQMELEMKTWKLKMKRKEMGNIREFGEKSVMQQKTKLVRNGMKGKKYMGGRKESLDLMENNRLVVKK